MKMTMKQQMINKICNLMMNNKKLKYNKLMQMKDLYRKNQKVKKTKPQIIKKMVQLNPI